MMVSSLSLMAESTSGGGSPMLRDRGRGLAMMREDAACRCARCVGGAMLALEDARVRRMLGGAWRRSSRRRRCDALRGFA
ncbi:hypothetical protein BVRB_7g165680 [Beta vulgaris subsp. vulgaris]|nr:hypothetical protein BVRB_7g165680 [Beta vulgaris subsp. vulgaris]